MPQSARPQDIIADDVDHIQVGGMQVRKGTVAAFLANIERLENPNSSAEEQQEALQIMEELAPAIVAVGMHRHVTFKNKRAEAIIQQAEIRGETI